MGKQADWTYWLGDGAKASEYGLWAGDAAPVLGSHFHEEGQLTAVLAGSRKFTRDVGMSPHAYRIVDRLNAARRQLRAGAGIAETAVDFGFADQSHFGRHFFRVFGITPSAYRNGMRRSQTF